MPGCLKRTDQSIPEEAAKAKQKKNERELGEFIHRNKGYCDI
jgi:hypothetical protein